jgi:diguanylate cyclase (GGDEF)-like protein
MAAVLAILLVVANGLVLFRGLESLTEASVSVRNSLDVRQDLSDVMAGLINAETGQRGFIITGNQTYLDPYHQAQFTVGESIQRITTAVADTPVQAALLERLRDAVAEKFDNLAHTIAVRSIEGDAAARAIVQRNEGKEIMDEVRVLVSEMTRTEGETLAIRQQAYDNAQRWAFISVGIFVAATLSLVVMLRINAVRNIARRDETARQINAYAADLNRSLEELKTERNEIALVNSASNFLQSCNSLTEVGQLVGPFMERVFPRYDGAVHIFAASRNQLDLLAHWGGHDEISPDISPVFSPEDCWALRRGQEHVHSAALATPKCDHLHATAAPETLCVPMIAHGETLGVLSLVAHASNTGEVRERKVADPHPAMRLAEMLTRQLGLTVANIRLRESLNEQSIRDPLTNAFNRRYLEIVAQKEVSQARRAEEHLAVVMLDVDHFKRFNDLHGHAAGDVALSTMAAFVQENIRETDWFFRYGGEEFMLLVRGLSRAMAMERLELLRQSIASLQLRTDETVLPRITVSMGVAMMPEHGIDFDDLVSIADEALYKAKHEGRNRVMMAPPRVIEDEGAEPVALIA